MQIDTAKSDVWKLNVTGVGKRQVHCREHAKFDHPKTTICVCTCIYNLKE